MWGWRVAGSNCAAGVAGAAAAAGAAAGYKNWDNFFSDSFLKGDFPYFCSPFWGNNIFLLSSVG